MGLFDKKTCAICGGKVKGLFPLHLGDDYVCDDCSIFIHAHDDVLQKMTLDDFLKYKEFHQENQKLKDIFEMTKVCEYGLVFNKLYLDSNHHLFCLNSDLSTTIFEAKYVDRFTIMEDSFPLYEGTAEGLNYYPSEVPSYARSLTPLVIQMHQEYERFEDEVGYIQPGLREPFEKFYITIYLKDHPYWPSIELKYDGPTFTAPTPDISRYLREYTEKVTHPDGSISACPVYQKQ